MPMRKKLVNLPKLASPTMEQVLDEFLSAQRKRLNLRAFTQYSHIIDLFKNCMNSYGYQSLTKAESALFEKHFNATGDQRRQFCQIFGPDKIIENIGEFLSYFMIRKVIAGRDLMRAAGTVTKKLSAWLTEAGYVPLREAEEGGRIGAEAARELPRADRVAYMLFQSTQSLSMNPNEVDEEDYIDFDHFVISRIEPGRIWLEPLLGEGTFGPISVPEKATEMLREGWEMSCALGRIRGRWRIMEMGSVYPL